MVEVVPALIEFIFQGEIWPILQCPSCEAAWFPTFDFFSCIVQITGKQSYDKKQKLPELCKGVAVAVSDVIQAAEVLKGQTRALLMALVFSLCRLF